MIDSINFTLPRKKPMKNLILETTAEVVEIEPVTDSSASIIPPALVELPKPVRKGRSKPNFKLSDESLHSNGEGNTVPMEKKETQLIENTNCGTGNIENSMDCIGRTS